MTSISVTLSTSNGKVIPLSGLRSDMSFYELWSRVNEETFVPTARFTLMSRGVELAGDDEGDCMIGGDVEDGDVIQVVVNKTNASSDLFLNAYHNKFRAVKHCIEEAPDDAYQLDADAHATPIQITTSLGIAECLLGVGAEPGEMFTMDLETVNAHLEAGGCDGRMLTRSFGDGVCAALESGLQIVPNTPLVRQIMDRHSLFSLICWSVASSAEERAIVQVAWRMSETPPSLLDSYTRSFLIMLHIDGELSTDDALVSSLFRLRFPHIDGSRR